ncbi:protein kinase PINOID-like isoform X2 [Miscanthus floridulus]|uniref:protein kinase PINOID-like isoform X2 n=1 Tax=Miscanthus floridulus TaxID=154761 RepID=UPI00345A1EE4
MKLVDRRIVAKNNRLERAASEKRILRVLDHPFLPRLFTGFDIAPHFSCVVMVFSPAGGLHSLRHHMRKRRFPLPSARPSNRFCRPQACCQRCRRDAVCCLLCLAVPLLEPGYFLHLT